jgi:hypothetical protein
MTYPRRNPWLDFAPAVISGATGVALGWTALLALGWWMARKALRFGR